ncbi:unnamed protein product [Laminaria digitata]
MHMTAHPESMHIYVLEIKEIASKQDHEWVVILPTSAPTLPFLSAVTRSCASAMPAYSRPIGTTLALCRLIAQSGSISSEGRETGPRACSRTIRCPCRHSRRALLLV